MEDGKDRSVVIDNETHRDLKMMAARRQVSIKQVLKELVDKAKKEEKNA
jgi:predicted DNA-binding ribbon-helix-helix protein